MRTEQRIDLRFEDKPGYLAVSSSGSWQIDAVKVAIDSLKAESEKRGCQRVLWDARRVADLSSNLERHVVGKHIAQVWRSTLKVALLYPEESITRVAELAAHNRGAQFLVTADREHALLWLLQGMDAH